LNTATIYRFDNASSDGSLLVDHVRRSVTNARLGYSKLTVHPHSKEILDMVGMSSVAQRHLLNNLCSAWNSRYLEIGVWEAATFIAALAGNERNIKSSLGIDWWAWDNDEQIAKSTNNFDTSEILKYRFGPSGSATFDRVLQRMKSYISPDAKTGLLRADCFSVDIDELLTINNNQLYNIYFYDAGHEQRDQYMAFTYFNKILAPLFVAVVDDW